MAFADSRHGVRDHVDLGGGDGVRDGGNRALIQHLAIGTHHPGNALGGELADRRSAVRGRDRIVVGGEIEVPERPGLGFALDDEYLAERGCTVESL